jgi:hypothetical protein
MTRAQHDTFRDGEADSWYARNKEGLVGKYSGDHLLDYLTTLDLTDSAFWMWDVATATG